MLEILFFASIRERLGVQRLSLPIPAGAVTVQSFRQSLIDNHNQDWAEVLLADNVITAVNQQVVAADHQLHEGDELAFFPPVTGG